MRPGPAPLLALAIAAPLLGAPAGPPQARPSFRPLSLEQGLSQAAVLDLAQDATGFLWAATQDGLNRFDGYGFTVLRHDPADPDSLPDSNVTALATGRGNVLWVGGADRGVARLDLTTLRATRFAPEPLPEGRRPNLPVLSLLEDRSGALWVGTGGGGLLRLAPGSSRFESFAPVPGDAASFPSPAVFDLAEDPSGSIWAATLGAGLLRLDAASGRVLSRFDRDPETGERPPNPTVNCVMSGRDGAVWAGAGGLLARVDPATGKVRLFRHDPRDPSSFPSEQARHLAEDREGRIWVATEAGLVRLDPSTGAFTAFRNRSDDASSLPSNRTSRVLADRSGLLWVGSDGAGLAVLDLVPSPFRTYRREPGRPDGLTAPLVRGVFEGREGTLWLGLAQGGLNAFDPATGRARAWRVGSGPRDLTSDDVWNVVEDEDGVVWAATLGGGLDRVDPRTGLVTVFRARDGDPGSLSNDALRIVHLGSDGYLWIGTAGGGLCRFDRATGKARRYRNDRDDPASLSNDVVRAVHEGRSGALWVGTDAGVNLLDRATGKVTRFLDDPARPEAAGIARVYGVYEDAAGILWVGTPRGLVRLDPRTGSVRRFRQADGLPNDTVYSILPDDAGSLWVSTNRGLCRVTPSADGATASFRTFDALDGLQSDEFNGGSFHRGPSGTLWFGGILGLTGVVAKEVADDPFAPPVSILSFSRLGKRLPPSQWAPGGRVVLGPGQGFFSVEFSALSFRAAAKNAYSWRLEGLDPEWVDGGTRRRADYTSVPPGDYVFRVRAANKDGVRNEEGASLSITVLPPWWRTRGALAGWALLLAGGVLTVSRLEKRRILGKERERSRLVEAELRARAAEAQSRAVQAESDRKTAELEEARALQLSLLPRDLPSVPGYSVAAMTRTASEVGGDTWDWVAGPDGGLAVVVGDATGHGLRAGTVVSVMKGLFRGNPFPEDLGSFLDRSGRVMRDLGLSRLHMALAVLVVRDGNATFSSAGMPPALVHRARTGDVEEVLVPGAPLGALLDSPHAVRTFRLEPGDTVLLASDGLAESPGPGGEPLGYGRAREIFRNAASLSPGALVERVAAEEERWRGEAARQDDLTLVTLRREA